MHVNYGTGLKAELLSFVHRVCETEANVSLYPGRLTNWYANPEIFAASLALKPVRLKMHADRPLKFLVSEFTLLLDEGDTSLAIVKSPKDELQGDLEGDSFAEYMLEQAVEIYDAHDHGACITAARPPVGTPISWLRRLDGAGSAVQT